MDAGRLEEALSLLSQLPPSPSVQLLQGICELRAGFDREAASSLERARTDPELAPQADSLLSLVYLADGDARAAEKTLATAEGSTAQQLLKLAAREGILVLRGELGSGVDTNPALVQTQAPAQTSPPAGAGELSTSALLRSRGSFSPFLQASASARRLPGQSTWDSTLGQAGGGVTLSQTLVRADVDYAFEGMRLGASPYLTAHQVRARGMLLWSRVHLAADYLGRLESYAASDARTDHQDFSDFSGLTQGGGVLLGYSPNPHVTFEAGYRLSSDQARTDQDSFTEHGPGAFLLISGQDVRLQVSAALLLRSYDDVNVNFGMLQQDTRAEAHARAEWDLGRIWTAFASVDAFEVQSSIPALSSTRVVAQLGMAFTLGLL
jgi:hypothetical protein